MELQSPGTEPRRPRREITRAERNARWIEKYLRVPDGTFVGKPLRLSKAQREWLALIYDSQTRMFILSMARKNGKTATASMIVLLHLVGPEAVAQGQLYSAALSRDQAAIIFKHAATMVRLSPELNRYVQIRDTAKQLLCPELGTMYHALSAEASTAFGLSPTLVIHDELGQIRGPRSLLFEALETASAAQQRPLSVVISTQAPDPNDLFNLLIDKARDDPTPRVKCVVYEAPLDADPFSAAAIRAANPHYDRFMNKEEVESQMSGARRLPALEASYRNLILNQRIEEHNVFVPPAVWKENGAKPEPLGTQPLFVGLDLAAVSDLCACVALSVGGDMYPTFWLPAEGLAEKSRGDRVPYDVWAKQGFLTTTPGRAIEYEYVADFLRGMFDKYDIRAVAFDRYNIKFLRPWLVKVGFTEAELARFIEFGQGFVSMSPALRAVEAKLLERKYKHGDNPIMNMCSRNAVIVQDPAGNRKFAKHKSTGRIDGLVALAMAEGVMPSEPPAASVQMFTL